MSSPESGALSGLGRASRLMHAVADVALPEPCVLCGAPPRALCQECQGKLNGPPEWTSLGGLRLCVVGVPASDMLALVRAFKDDSRTGLARHLVRALVPALREVRARYPEITACAVPPSPWQSWRKRGFHPVPFVLRRAGVVVLPVLRRQRARVDQRRLSVSARRENVAGAFEASRPLRGHTFLVIDDVVTTGATMSEAVRAITEAGGRVACAVAFVRVPLERSCTQNATPNKTDG